MSIKRFPQIYAHRGGAALWPENTLPAYEKAIALRVDAIDMDVGVTKDNVVVVYHDFCLNPAYTCDKDSKWLEAEDLLIHQFIFEELQQFDVGVLNKNSDYGKSFPKQEAIPGTRISCLKDIIQYGKSVAGNTLKFQIEMKSHPGFSHWTVSPEKFAELVAEIIAEEKIYDQAEVQSFDWRCLQALQRIDERIVTAYLTCDADEAARTTEENLLWHAGFNVGLYNNSWPELISYLGGKIWGPDYQDLTFHKVLEAHKYNLKVVPWTVDAPEDMQRMADMEVDGIITNYPDKLLRLRRRSEQAETRNAG